MLGGKNNASAVIENGRQAGADGNVQNVAFSFSETGDIQLGAAIVPATSFFKDFGPSALPSREAHAHPLGRRVRDARARRPAAPRPRRTVRGARRTAEGSATGRTRSRFRVTPAR